MKGDTRDRIQALLDGDLKPGEREALRDALLTDAEAAGELDQALRLEAALAAAHLPEPDVEGACRAIWRRVAAERRPFWLHALPLAAAAIAAVIGVAAIWFRAATQPAHVAEGIAYSEGVAVRRVHAGQTVTAGPESPVVLDLPDGSVVKLLPRATVTIHGRRASADQAVELTEGKAEFSVTPRGRAFRVITSVGSVTVLGTEFSVAMNRNGTEGGRAMDGRAVLAMAVAVTVGSVQVDVGGRTYTLSAGQTQVFAEEGGKGDVRAPKPPRVRESERGGESAAQPVAPRRGEGEGERAGRPAAKTVSGEVADLSGSALRIAQRGDKGASEATVILQSDTLILVESDRMESVTGEGGATKQRRVLVPGSAADLAAGKRVSATVEGGDKCTKVVVRAAVVRGGGESREGGGEVKAPRERREGGGER
jgi:ferric-dicitrate binding protein FerR (iron transport regulator)